MSFADLLTETVTVTRFGASGFVDGLAVPGATTVLTLQASVQPVGGRELLNFPEAQRTRAAIKLYATELLRTADETAGTQADRVTVSGQVFEVHQAEQWTQLGLGHYKAIAFRVDG